MRLGASGSVWKRLGASSGALEASGRRLRRLGASGNVWRRLARRLEASGDVVLKRQKASSGGVCKRRLERSEGIV